MKKKANFFPKNYVRKKAKPKEYLPPICNNCFQEKSKHYCKTYKPLTNPLKPKTL